MYCATTNTLNDVKSAPLALDERHGHHASIRLVLAAVVADRKVDLADQYLSQ